MNLVTLLLLLFVTAAFLQLSFLAQSSWKSLCATRYSVPNYSGYSNLSSIVISSILFSLPLIFLNFYKSLEYTSALSDSIFLISLTSVTVFLILLDRKVIWSKKFRKALNPTTNAEEEIQKLNIEVANKIEENKHVSNNIVTNFNQKFLQTEKITLNNRNEIVSLSWNLYHAKKELRNTALTVFKNRTKSESELEQIEKQVQNLTKKVTSKPRKSELRDEKIKVAKQQFDIFKSDLRKLPEFNSLDKKFDSFENENLTELQTYQTAMTFFMKNYNLIEGTPKTIVFKLFTEYFNFSNLKSSNWKKETDSINMKNDFYALLENNLKMHSKLDN